MFGMHNQPLRLVLNSDDFRILVRGGVVKQDGAEIILQDIGYLTMLKIIDQARSDLYQQKE